MGFDLTKLKEIRIHLNITQSDLANLSGVSQSLIAKIESGILDPSYTKAQKIIAAIESATRKQNIKARDIMHSRIISSRPEENIKSVVVKMNRNNISQIPVICDNIVAGFVSERILLDAIIDQDNKGKSAEDIMEPAPPVVSGDTPIDAVVALLRHFPMTLVSQDGKLKGIITKSDIITKLHKNNER